MFRVNGILGKAGLLLLSAALLCMIAGCDKNEGSASTQESSTRTESSTGSESSTGTESTTGSTEDSSSTPSAPDSSSEESTGSTSEPAVGQAEFDFDEAVKSITLFGNKISLPCTIADFGEDFSIGGYPLQASDGGVVCSIFYKNERLGSLGLADCNVDDDDFNDKQITSLTLGFGINDKYEKVDDSFRVSFLQRAGWYSGLIDINFGGITFKSSLGDVESIMGSPDVYDTSIGELLECDYSELKYKYPDGEYVNIAFYSTRLTEIMIIL